MKLTVGRRGSGWCRESTDTDNNVVKARGAVVDGWRGTQGGQWGTSVIVSTIQGKGKGKEKEAAFLQCPLFLKLIFHILITADTVLH